VESIPRLYFCGTIISAAAQYSERKRIARRLEYRLVLLRANEKSSARARLIDGSLRTTRTIISRYHRRSYEAIAYEISISIRDINLHLSIQKKEDGERARSNSQCDNSARCEGMRRDDKSIRSTCFHFHTLSATWLTLAPWFTVFSGIINSNPRASRRRSLVLARVSRRVVCRGYGLITSTKSFYLYLSLRRISKRGKAFGIPRRALA